MSKRQVYGSCCSWKENTYKQKDYQILKAKNKFGILISRTSLHVFRCTGHTPLHARGL